MAERWAKPVVPLVIEQHESEGVLMPDGRVFRQPVFVLKPEDVDRLRAGYVCIKCFQTFEQAWPELCPVCGCHVRRDQAAYFAREYGGDQRLGPSTSLADERERLREGVDLPKED